MSVFYGIDAEPVHTAGQQVSGLSGDVDAAGSSLTQAVEAVAVGQRHGVQGIVSPGLTSFREWSTLMVGSVSTGVENLGTNTSNGASTSVDTTNDCTRLFNGSATDSTALESLLLRPVCAP